MAIVMVFTYMPSGMGVETAWADASVITTAEGFAAMDANGNYVLGGDITIAEPYADEFTGTFDGDGHTVTLDGTTNGVFASTAASAVIQNLGVKGTVSGGETIAGVVGMNAGTIKNCKNAADITIKCQNWLAVQLITIMAAGLQDKTTEQSKVAIILEGLLHQEQDLLILEALQEALGQLR